MRDTTSAWTVASSAHGSASVALVQAATVLPTFLLALPAGVLADHYDRRFILIVYQLALASAGATLAVLSYLHSLGGRLPLLNPAHLTDVQKTLFNTLLATWITFAGENGVQATTDDDRLIGPFNPFLLHPEVTDKLSDLQVAEAARSTLSARSREVVIIMTGAVWRADHELYAQLGVARGTGLS